MTQSTAKPSLRDRLKQAEKQIIQLKLAADNASIVANSFFWKTGMKNRDQCKAVVDEYMAFMTAKVQEAEKEQQSSVQVMENFVDPTLLAKVAEHAGEGAADSSE